MTHICVGKLLITGLNNGLSPWRRQAIIWTNAEILLFGPLGTNFIKITIGIQTFLFKKIRSKISSGKLRPFCLGLNVLRSTYYQWSDPKIDGWNSSHYVTAWFEVVNDVSYQSDRDIFTPWRITESQFPVGKSNYIDTLLRCEELLLINSILSNLTVEIKTENVMYIKAAEMLEILHY